MIMNDFIGNILVQGRAKQDQAWSGLIDATQKLGAIKATELLISCEKDPVELIKTDPDLVRTLVLFSKVALREVILQGAERKFREEEDASPDS